MESGGGRPDSVDGDQIWWKAAATGQVQYYPSPSLSLSSLP
jgi:hypothetical protein